MQTAESSIDLIVGIDSIYLNWRPDRIASLVYRLNALDWNALSLPPPPKSSSTASALCKQHLSSLYRPFFKCLSL